MALVLGQLTDSGGADYDLAAKSREINCDCVRLPVSLEKVGLTLHSFWVYYCFCFEKGTEFWSYKDGRKL